jgi:hypothetical protein
MIRATLRDDGLRGVHRRLKIQPEFPACAIRQRLVRGWISKQGAIYHGLIVEGVS